MARHESDREDLLAEAVALTRRVEGLLPGSASPIIAGFRAGDWLSVYFGPDPMYQVDNRGQLRRAFERGLLYRTQGETLSRLTRIRTDTETVLVRCDLTPAELTAFRGRMTDRLAEFLAGLESNSFRTERQIPGDDALLLEDLAARLQLALSVEPWIAPPISPR